MHLASKLFGEILPFRIDPRRGYASLKGGLAWDGNYFEADRAIMFPVEDGAIKVRVGYNELPSEMDDPEWGATWFHPIDGLKFRVVLPSDGFHYDFNVRMLSTPDYFLNEAGRPEPHPPSESDGIRWSDYTLEIIDNQWWTSDERSVGHEWYFSVNDLPHLPSIQDSDLCQLNTVPGTYPGAYFTCTLDGHQFPNELVEYWFSYELESQVNRPYPWDSDRLFDRYQYRFRFGRTDKQELHINEGHKILDLWEYLLGFCSASFRSFDLVIGYGDRGGLTYSELPRRLTKQIPYRTSWFPREWPFDFPAFACQFLTHFQKEHNLRSKTGGVPINEFDPNLRVGHSFGAAIPILEGYFRAASLEVPQDMLNAAFATLESEVKRRLNLPDRSSVPPEKLVQFMRNHSVPPNKIHLGFGFGSYQNTSWEFPRDIDGIKKSPPRDSDGFARSWVVEPNYKPDKDADPDFGEYGFPAIKAWRDKRGAHYDAHAGGGTIHAIQNYAQLILEYLELVVLNQIGYTGLYRSRTGMFHQAVRHVPWTEAKQ